MGILQIIYVKRVGLSETMVILSLITTWTHLGMRVVRLGDLPKLWHYKYIELKKIGKLEAQTEVELDQRGRTQPHRLASLHLS